MVSPRIARRYPHQVGKDIAKGINAGRIEFADKHLSMFPQDLTYGYYSLKKTHGDPKKPLDWAIIEATAINGGGLDRSRRVCRRVTRDRAECGENHH